MNVRNLATVLWFMAGWSGAGLVVGLLGLPSPLAIAGGVATAALVRWDPSGRLWKTGSGARRVRPIEDVARELDERAAVPSPAAEERYPA